MRQAPLVRPGLRERKKAETRQTISDAALALAMEHGPAAVTVDDIARAANVSTRTVFNYFPSKEAAILGFAPDRLSEMVDKLAQRPASEAPLEALRNTLRGSLPESDAAAWRARARLAREFPQVHAAYVAGFAAIENDLAAAIARRVGLDATQHPYPRLVVSIALTAARVAVGHAIGRRGEDTLSGVVDEAFTCVAAGLPAPLPQNPTEEARMKHSHESPC